MSSVTGDMNGVTKEPHQRRERRLGDRLTTTTSLSFEEAFETIRLVCEGESKWRRSPYHVQRRRNHILVGYRASSRAAARRARPGLLAGHWLVAVRFPCDDHTAGTTRRGQAIRIQVPHLGIESGR